LFDLLYRLTDKERYKKAADPIYKWLIGPAFDRKGHGFRRGGVFKTPGWILDGPGRLDGLDQFAPDTTFWAPLERLLDDPDLGPDRAGRLGVVASMLDRCDSLTGVTSYGRLVGHSFAPSGKDQGIISAEWSCQCALRHLRVAQEWTRLGQTGKAAHSYNRY